MGGVGVWVALGWVGGWWTRGAIKKEFDFVVRRYGPGLGLGRLFHQRAVCREATAFSDRVR